MRKEITKCGMKDGLWTCERKAEQKDGSFKTIAVVGARQDKDCNLVVQNMEGEDKAMSQLHEHMVNNMKTNCEKK